MADYFTGEISIPKKFLTPTLLEWIKNEGIKEEGQEFNGVVSFVNHNARNGEFETLESKLVEAMIPFDRNSEGFCDIAPEERRFRPNEIDDTRSLTTQGEAYVVTSHLRKLLAMTPDDAYLELAKLIAASDPQVKPLEEHNGQILSCDCGDEADVSGFCSDACRWETNGVPEEQINRA